jgi:hypothetical protein
LGSSRGSSWISRAARGRPSAISGLRFRWVTPGSLVAIVVWIVASALFAFYVSNFSERAVGLVVGTPRRT